MSTLSPNEKKALNDIFISLTKKETVLSKFQEKKGEIKHFFKLLFMRSKKRYKHHIR